ncbi:MAG TPA: RNA polymerase sigma-54 factor, partial [Thermoanaerobaculia bacterium]
MGLEQKLSLKLSQRLVMTPTLQQAIKLLQMTRLELSDIVNEELVANPALEEDEGNAEGTGEGDSPAADAASEGTDEAEGGDKAETSEPEAADARVPEPGMAEREAR